MSDRATRQGLGLAVLAYGTWGVVPIYWKQLRGVGAAEILSFRVLGALVVGGALLVGQRRVGATLELLRAGKSRRALLAATLLIATNWGLFLWAVTGGRIAEASLGYLINPLLNALLGRLVLGERLAGGQTLAVGLAGATVVALAASGAGVPWLALALATTFALYGLVRKQAAAGPLEGFTVEAALAAPLALVYLLMQGAPTAFLHADATTRAFLLGAGPVTALPLLAFAAAARRLRYTTLGMLQFLSPPLQLACAVVLYGEPLSPRRALAFGTLAIAGALYAFEGHRRAPA